MYDIIVIGGGPGGYPCAIRCAQYGLSVCLVEEHDLGGVCLNKGCIPTKSLFAVAREVENTRFTGAVDKQVSFHWDKILKQLKTDVVLRLRAGINFLLKQNGIEVIQGRGIIRDRHVVQASGKTLEGRHIVVATGGTPCTPEICRTESKTLTSDDLWKMDRLPESLAIVGGGVIGCEFASILNAFGVKTTIYEMTDSLLPGKDKDISATLEASLKKAGVEVVTGKKIENAGQLADKEKILVAVGRTPNTAPVEELNPERDNGALKTDEKMQTSIEGVFAIGDVNGKYPYAYVATREGEVAAENAAGKERDMDYRAIPEAVFTGIEIGTCGLTEAAAKEQGMQVKTGKFPYSALGKAYAEKSTEGFVKVVADSDRDEILGIHIIGKGATELVSFATLVVKNRLKVGEVENLLYCHPTYAEGIMEAAQDVHKKSVHLPPSKKYKPYTASST